MVVPERIREAATFGNRSVGGWPARTGAYDRVKRWVEKPKNDINDNERDKWGGGDGDTLLACVAQCHGASRDEAMEAIEMLEYLLAHGADPNISNRWGMTPLHHACETGFDFGSAAIPILLAAGADVHAKTTECGYYPCCDMGPYRLRGETPLSRAVQWFRGGRIMGVRREGMEYISRLLRHGARLDDCWGGASMEACLRHVEERLGVDPELGVRIDSDIREDIAENEHFVACKALVRKVRYERGPRRF